MITIIIPTHNRPAYLRRILSYYSDYEMAYDIIVADSSSNHNKEINKTISSLPRINISYMDTYPSEINTCHKLTDALNHVSIKYCVLCADDDFITLDGIKQSMNFLEENPDFTVA